MQSYSFFSSVRTFLPSMRSYLTSFMIWRMRNIPNPPMGRSSADSVNKKREEIKIFNLHHL